MQNVQMPTNTSQTGGVPAARMNCSRHSRRRRARSKSCGALAEPVATAGASGLAAARGACEEGADSSPPSRLTAPNTKSSSSPAPGEIAAGVALVARERGCANIPNSADAHGLVFPLSRCLRSPAITWPRVRVNPADAVTVRAPSAWLLKGTAVYGCTPLRNTLRHARAERLVCVRPVQSLASPRACRLP